MVRDTLATNLLPEIGLCAIFTGGQQNSRDLPFRLTLDTWSATLSRPTLLLETGLRAMDDDNGQCTPATMTTMTMMTPATTVQN